MTVRKIPGPRASGLPLTPLSEVPGPMPRTALSFCQPGTSDKDLDSAFPIFGLARVRIHLANPSYSLRA